MGRNRKWERREWKQIRARRHRAFPEEAGGTRTEDPGPPENMVGLALSGGGIRSALYNDGFLQGLSHRGLLRYVDYLASVSGGGYIAGHLTAQAESSDDPSKPGTEQQKRGSFHDDPKRWHLGRHPRTGKVDEQRLAGVGGYLTHPLELIPAYLWSFFFSAAFYIGASGILATLAALLWRSFDDPIFRILYFDALGLDAGHELVVAFIPAILLTTSYVLLEGAFSLVRWLFGFHRPLLQRCHVTVRAVSLVVIVLSLLTSMAVFLGNGRTNLRVGGSELFLNSYSQALILTAAVVQILVFFGRDRLFRSERQEAKAWQKRGQKVLIVGVTLFFAFAFVHWMAREDISNYTAQRDPYLVPGDVTDWTVLAEVFAEAEKEEEEPKLPTLESTDRLPPFLKPRSNLIETLSARHFGWLYTPDKLEDSHPAQDAYAAAGSGSESAADGGDDADVPTWMLGKRLLGAWHAYRLAVLENGQPTVPDVRKPPKVTGEMSVREAMEATWVWTKWMENKQHDALKKWNKSLQQPELTRFLLRHQATGPEETKTTDPANQDKLKSETDAESLVAVADEVGKLAESGALPLTAIQRQSLVTASRALAVDGFVNASTDEYSQTQAYAQINRTLLEAMFPAALQQMAIPSTLVVPPHDQRVRRGWLAFWLALAALGALGGLFRHRVATVFHFYRRHLGENFLVRSTDRSVSMADVSLSRIRPTEDGLPYPLFFAAAMEPVRVNDSYRVAAEPFLFSPDYAGNYRDPDDEHRQSRREFRRADGVSGLFESKDIGLRRSPSTPPVNLGDAVTLSGAAVSHLMTTNRVLSVLLDFFNTGLGQRLYRAERSRDIRRGTRPQSLGLPWFLMSLAALAFGGLIYLWSMGDWPSTVVAMCFALLVGISVLCEIGSPHFLLTLLRPREIGDNAQHIPTPHAARSFYVADGGFCDYLGVTALFERRCQMIIVSDAGANIGDDPLGTLADMCERATSEMGVRFLDLDHEGPIDFGRLEYDEQRLVHQPYLCIRVRYPEEDAPEGLLFYCQMAITDRDPIEIRQIRNRFPSFPDEPTVNQFYTAEQVSAYRALGFHVASRLCRELERWPFELSTPDDDPPNGGGGGGSAAPAASDDISVFADPALPVKDQYTEALLGAYAADCGGEADGLPLFPVLRERLLTAYRLACHEEISYREDDIFSEAVWPTSVFAFPGFRARAESLHGTAADCPQGICRDPAHGLALRWLRAYEQSADVRSAYRQATLKDINRMEVAKCGYSARLWFVLSYLNDGLVSDDEGADSTVQLKPVRADLLAAHLVATATACQEVHRGRPHAAFQVGGREKLVELCSCIARQIVQHVARPIEDTDQAAADLRKHLDAIVAEVTELERSVFQGGEHVTTISFTQCVMVIWARIARGPHTDDADERIVKAAAECLQRRSIDGTPLPGQMIESRMVELRRDLHRGLRTMNLTRVVNALLRSWYLAHLDEKELRGAEFLADLADPVKPSSAKPVKQPGQPAPSAKKKTPGKKPTRKKTPPKKTTPKKTTRKKTTRKKTTPKKTTPKKTTPKKTTPKKTPRKKPPAKKAPRKKPTD